MKILVTGRHGFTGRYLAEALEARGHEVVSFDADVTDPVAVRDAVAAARPDAVAHLAGVAFVQSSDFASFYAVNQIGTFHLLEALATEAPGIPVLLASSANIYGNAASGFLSEQTPPDPVNHYAVSKWGMEMGARLWADTLRILVARPFNYTGVGQQDRYLIPKIIGHFRRREPRIELGNLDVRRDFGDVRSVVEAYCGLLETTIAPDVFNVCSGRVHSIRDIIAIATELTGHRLEVSVNPAFVRANDVALLAGNPERLRQALPGWQPRDIRATIEWMLAAPDTAAA